MLLSILVALALSFTTLSYIFKKGTLAFTAGAVWIIASVHCFSLALVDWDTYFCLGFLFIALVLVCAVSPLAWRETTPAGETPEEPDVRDMREEMEAFDRERNQYAFLRKRGQPKRRATRW